MPRSQTKIALKPKQTRGSEMVEHVYSVTLTQLAENGFARLSVPDVAAIAGVNKTSIYRRWPTKADLVRDALHASMNHPEQVPDTGDLRADMLLVARVAVGFGRSPVGAGVLRALLAEGADPEIQLLARKLHKQEANGAMVLLKRAVRRGDLPKDANLHLMLSVIAGTILQRMSIEQSPVNDHFLQQLIDLVLRGVKAR
jgi:AcrR family transcriptional regulator